MSRDDSNFFATLKFSAFFEATLDQLVSLIGERTLATRSDDFNWMWNFFAEPRDQKTLKEFWLNVIIDAEKILRDACLHEKRTHYSTMRREMLLMY